MKPPSGLPSSPRVPLNFSPAILLRRHLLRFAALRNSNGARLIHRVERAAREPQTRDTTQGRPRLRAAGNARRLFCFSPTAADGTESKRKPPPLYRGRLWCRAARQADREHRPLTRLARHRHLAAHHARELADELTRKTACICSISGAARRPPSGSRLGALW